jgi:hypothetical protein
VLVFVDTKANIKKAKAAAESQLRAKGLSAELKLTQISLAGAAQSGNWKRRPKR